MQRFARIADGIVAEIILLPDDLDIATAFHPDLLSAIFAAPDEEVVEGWLFDGSVYSPPVVEPPPPPVGGTSPPVLIAAAYGVNIADFDVASVDASYNVAAVVYADVGQYYLFFPHTEPDTAYFATINGGAPFMQVSVRDVDFLIVEAKDAAGAYVDPASFTIEIKRL